MKKSIIASFTALLSFYSASAQNESVITNKLKVFIDCSNTYCDMSFIRTEINLVDFMLDRIAADVHILVTEQNTGSGGDQYQLIFFGQHRFKSYRDTLQFNTDPNATDFEERDLLIKYIKLGLTPFVAKTDAAKDVAISFKRTETEKDTASGITKDPWNYWVYRIGTDGYLNEDAVYKNNQFSGNLSANRTTEQLKLFFSISASKNKSTFEYEDSGVVQKIIVKNKNFNAWHY